MPNVPRLPLEIIDLIVSSIPHDEERITTLAACNSLSALWHAASSPYLFQSVQIYEENRAEGFVALITLYPEIASFVKILMVKNTARALVWVTHPNLRFPNVTVLLMRAVFVFESSHPIPTNLLSTEALPSLVTLSISHTYIENFRDLHSVILDSRISQFHIGFLVFESGLATWNFPSSSTPPPESLNEIWLRNIDNPYMLDQICSWLALSSNIRRLELVDLDHPCVHALSKCLTSGSETLQHLGINCNDIFSGVNAGKLTVALNQYNHLTSKISATATINNLPIHLLNNLVSLTFAIFPGFQLKLPDDPHSLVLIRLTTTWTKTQAEFDNAVREVKDKLDSLPSFEAIQLIVKGVVISEIERAALE